MTWNKKNNKANKKKSTKKEKFGQHTQNQIKKWTILIRLCAIHLTTRPIIAVVVPSVFPFQLLFVILLLPRGEEEATTSESD